MRRVMVICVGRMKERFYAGAAAEYIKRLSRYCKLEIVELPEQRLPENPVPAGIRRALAKEAEAIRAKLPQGAAVAALCIEGKLHSSEDVARLLGAPTKRLTAITIMISCGIAGLTGILMGPIYFVTYAMGSVAIGKGFTAIVLGGFGKVEGAVLGGLLLGVIETLLAAYVSPMFKDGFAFLVLVVILIFKPKGLLGEAVSQRV